MTTIAALDQSDEVNPLTQERVVGQYLTFMLAGEECGIDILTVQEIRRGSRITAIPNTPDYVRGVVNLRGLIVPVVNLHELFGKPQVGTTGHVIVVKFWHQNKERVMGLMADSVSDVYTLRESEVRDAPETNTDVNKAYIKGLASIDERLVILVDGARLVKDVRMKKVLSRFE